MSTGNADADEAVLCMVERYGMLMMDDIIISQSDFSWAQLFHAIDRLSRKDLIAVRRVGLSYQICPMSHALTLGQDQQHDEPAASHRW